MTARVTFELDPEVREALGAGRPVVALESTIVAHGMPYPRNVATARRVEEAVREGGATPATVAVVRGVVRVGLAPEDLDRLARGPGVRKLSRRDLGAAVALGEDGATTVAATMLLAHRAGIEVFVTGGIGGVHPGAGASFDVSADLEELGRTPVAVVCAGAKSILDLPATLEALETRGVAVLGYRTDRFPAFYSRDSGLPIHRRVDRVEDLARVIRATWALGLEQGVVVANPIPVEHEADPAVVGAAIEKARAEATAAGIGGKELTPFLLSRIESITGGASLDANVELVVSNARLGAALAVALGRSLGE